MATSTNEDQLNLRIDELVRKVEDALRAALGTVNIGENQALGLLSTADDLATAPVGDQAALLNAVGLGVLSGALNAADLAAFRTEIGLGAAATESTVPITKGGTGGTSVSTARANLNIGGVASYDTPSDGAHFNKAPFIRSDGVVQVGRYIDFFATSGSTANFDGRLNIGVDGTLYYNGNVVTHGGQAAGAIGSYAFLVCAATNTPGSLRSSSELFFSSANSNTGAGTAGTWRCMGAAPGGFASLYLRVS